MMDAVHVDVVPVVTLYLRLYRRRRRLEAWVDILWTVIPIYIHQTNCLVMLDHVVIDANGLIY